MLARVQAHNRVDVTTETRVLDRVRLSFAAPWGATDHVELSEVAALELSKDLARASDMLAARRLARREAGAGGRDAVSPQRSSCPHTSGGCGALACAYSCQSRGLT